MIRINLLGEQVDRTGSYIIQLLSYFGSLFILLMVLFFVYEQSGSKVEQLKDDSARLEQDLKILEKRTAEVKELEQKEKILKEKLSTIAQLKAKKHGPVHILSDLSSSIPERAWLEAAREKDGILELKGIALDNQTIALFMGDLSK